MRGVRAPGGAVRAAVLAAAGLAACAGPAPAPGPPSIVIRPAPPLRLPGTQKGETDCNNAVHWDGGRMYVFCSTGDPWRSSGPDLFHLGGSAPCRYDTTVSGARWIECTWRDADGTLYAWYHNEPHDVCPGRSLTAPRIGAVVSRDNGATFTDLGFILEAPPGSDRCDTQNHYFAGGNGDFSCMLDARGGYLYFFISTYHRDVAEQGVAVARMRWADRTAPVGKVWKWRDGAWSEPGLGGHVTPVFPAAKDWHALETDVFWGPAIHWNTHLEQYVVLLNHCTWSDHTWRQEGVYATFNREVGDPGGWTAPVKIHDGGAWYPQAIGTDAANEETDKRAGRIARFFMHGGSSAEIVFLRPGERP